MALQLTRNSTLCRMARQFCCNNITRSMSAGLPKVEDKSNGIHSISTHMHTVSNFDKWVLVWVKRFPSKDEVPKQVSQDCILQARSRARIRTCNIMMVVSLVGFILAVISGKRDAQAGKTLLKKREDWYQGLQEQRRAEEAAAAAAAAAAAEKH